MDRDMSLWFGRLSVWGGRIIDNAGSTQGIPEQAGMPVSLFVLRPGLGFASMLKLVIGLRWVGDVDSAGSMQGIPEQAGMPVSLFELRSGRETWVTEVPSVRRRGGRRGVVRAIYIRR